MIIHDMSDAAYHSRQELSSTGCSVDPASTLVIVTVRGAAVRSSALIC